MCIYVKVTITVSGISHIYDFDVQLLSKNNFKILWVNSQILINIDTNYYCSHTIVGTHNFPRDLF